MGKQVHLATRVDASKLLTSPDLIMQQMSIKIFQRREELLTSLVGTRVRYDAGDSVIRVGTVERLDESTNVVVRDGANKIRVPVRRILID